MLRNVCPGLTLCSRASVLPNPSLPALGGLLCCSTKTPDPKELLPAPLHCLDPMGAAPAAVLELRINISVRALVTQVGSDFSEPREPCWGSCSGLWAPGAGRFGHAGAASPRWGLSWVLSPPLPAAGATPGRHFLHFLHFLAAACESQPAAAPGVGR